MMNTVLVGEPVDVELIANWDGKAESPPGIFLEHATETDVYGNEVAILQIAGWVCGTVIAAVVGNSAYDAIKVKVVQYVTFWRRRQGKAKLEELKQHVKAELQKHASQGKLTPEQLNARVDAFFQEIQDQA